MNKLLIALSALFFFACSDFYPAFTSQGHPRIPPPDYWERSDTLGEASFTLGAQSKLKLYVSLDTNTAAKVVRLQNDGATVLAWDSLPHDTTILLDSSSSQAKELSYLFHMDYRVTQEDAPLLVQTLKLVSSRMWFAEQKILDAKSTITRKIPIENGDSLRLSLDCSPRGICDGELRNLAGTRLWSKQDSRTYKHKFNSQDTLSLLIENTSDAENLVHQDSAEVIRIIPVQ